MNRIIILFIALCCIAACKKPLSSPYPSDTYFRAYGNIPLDISNGNYSDYLNAGPIVSDPTGNMYFSYFPRGVNGISGPLSLIKADKNGNIIWNKNYFSFTTYGEASFYGNTYSDNFICNGQTLFLLGLDTTGNWTILKFNCSDGQYIGQVPLAGLLPANGTVGSLWFGTGGISLATQGNIFVYGSYSQTAGGATSPVLSLIDPQGNVTWTKSNYPDSLNGSSDGEYGSCIYQYNDGSGSFEFGTLIGRAYNITADSETISTTMVFYHMDNSGNVLQEDSMLAGTNVFYLNTYVTKYYNWTGYIYRYFVFPSPTGGFIIVADEWDEYNYMRIKIIKTGISFVATDSTYISIANGSVGITGVAQEADGTIAVSATENLTVMKNVFSFLYEIKSNLAVTGKQIGLSSQSLYISGINVTNDGYILMNGQMQDYGLDTNHLFIIKADGNGHY